MGHPLPYKFTGRCFRRYDKGLRSPLRDAGGRSARHHSESEAGAADPGRKAGRLHQGAEHPAGKACDDRCHFPGSRRPSFPVLPIPRHPVRTGASSRKSSGCSLPALCRQNASSRYILRWRTPLTGKLRKALRQRLQSSFRATISISHRHGNPLVVHYLHSAVKILRQHDSRLAGTAQPARHRNMPKSWTPSPRRGTSGRESVR